VGKSMGSQIYEWRYRRSIELYIGTYRSISLCGRTMILLARAEVVLDVHTSLFGRRVCKYLSIIGCAKRTTRASRRCTHKGRIRLKYILKYDVD
jgi:hypothetical protein